MGSRLYWVGLSLLGLSWGLEAAEEPGRDDFVHMANYAEIEDFPELAARGINTLLVELDADGGDWTTTYEAAIRHRLRLVPLIWGDDQSIWRWNRTAEEWELNATRYPGATGARFLQFLKEHPRYLRQTFAIYGFHEPLANPRRTGPARLKAFYRQITEEEFPGDQLRVYGEDMTLSWPDSDECLTGVLDYETHNVYPFATTSTGRYRPFDVVRNHYAPPTDDWERMIRYERDTLNERLRRYAAAPVAKTGRRPRAIVLIQCFSATSEPDLWNRMPTADEMERLATAVLAESRPKLAGLAWYPYRNPATEYPQSLWEARHDDFGHDRWEVLTRITQRLKRD